MVTAPVVVVTMTTTDAALTVTGVPRRKGALTQGRRRSEHCARVHSLGPPEGLFWCYPHFPER